MFHPKQISMIIIVLFKPLLDYLCELNGRFNAEYRGAVALISFVG